MTWTRTGRSARDRVFQLVYGAKKYFDAFDGNTFFAWTNRTGRRIGIDATISKHVYRKAIRGVVDPSLFKCCYCASEYAKNRCQIDHRIPWADYSMGMTDASSLNEALALQVWVGCNDPDNLVVCCGSCNASKGGKAVGREWIETRKAGAPY